MMNMFTLPKKGSLLPLFLLGASSLAVFWPALGHNFLINWDDSQYVVDNPAIKGLTFAHIQSAFTDFYVGNYAPLHIMSYMLDYEIWGLRASGFIFTNILLHTANGILFYLLLKRLSGERVWILFAGLIFLLHPVQVESVVWISQRKNLLAMWFFLVGFYFYTFHEDEKLRYRNLFYLLSLFAFILALLSKSVVVIFPLVLFLFDLCYQEKRGFWNLLANKIPFVVAALIFGIIALKSHAAQVQGGEAPYHGGSPYATFLSMLPTLVSYLRLVVWPVNLSAFYDVPIRTGLDSEVVWAGIVCFMLVVMGVMLYCHRRHLFFWFALFFTGLLPVSQIVPIVTMMNDRYLYFPMLGFSAFVCLSSFRNLRWNELLTSYAYLSVSAFFVIAIGAFTVSTVHRVGFWQDSATLWADAVKKSPNVALTHDCYGEGLLQQGRIDEAIRQFSIALGLQPSYTAQDLSPGTRNALANTHNNLGMAYGLGGLTRDAVEQFAIAIRLNPKFDRAYFNLGNALMHEGLMDQALRSFETAVMLNPGNPLFSANLKLTRELISARDPGNAATREE